jgi:sulfate/thiosulfate transport system permease protein
MTDIGRTRLTSTALGLRAFAVAYVGALVLVPLVVVTWRSLRHGFGVFADALADPATQHAFQVTLVVAGVAVVLDTVFGVAAAILLARYRFPGKRLINAVIDLPVAVSPIVVGLALVLVYGPSGWFGDSLTDTPFQVIYAKPGMVLATVFVSLPLVVRAVLPVLARAGIEQDQAAASLGADAVTRFRRITLPTIRVALLYGVVLTIARCLGEYGAVLVVSGNVEGQTETVPLRIDTLYSTDLRPDAAYALTFLLLLIALVAILIAAWIRRRQES